MVSLSLVAVASRLGTGWGDKATTPYRYTPAAISLRTGGAMRLRSDAFPPGLNRETEAE